MQREPQGRWQDIPLTGELHVRTDDANLVTLYVPDIDRSEGRLAADVQIAGTAGSPRFTGLVKVSDGAIDVFRINLSMRQIELQAQLGDTSKIGRAHV